MTPGPSDNLRESFRKFARRCSDILGSPEIFLSAVASIVVWGALGPVYHYSDTWQLVINTATTIVTFLMVFLIQNTQNREALAIQIKLSELIIAMKGAPNRIALIDQLSDNDLE